VRIEVRTALSSAIEDILHLIKGRLGDDWRDCTLSSHLAVLLEKYSVGFLLAVLSVVEVSALIFYVT
jgi:hypothetical protein